MTPRAYTLHGSLTAGVDEAGRGPLAGPVVAAAVILDPGAEIEGLTDSKALSPARRAELAGTIRTSASCWALGCAEVEEIDRLNILRAALLAMRRAVLALRIEPAHVQIDGNVCPELPCSAEAIVRGDKTVAAISAASILAKVARDALMMKLHEEYPQYGFARHKGYPTPQHMESLRAFGASPAHRRSFAPVRRVVHDCASLADE